MPLAVYGILNTHLEEQKSYCSPLAIPGELLYSQPELHKALNPLLIIPLEWAEAGDLSAEHLSICLGGSSGALPLQLIDVVWAVAPITDHQGGPWPHTLSRPSVFCPRIALMTQKEQGQPGAWGASGGSPKGDTWLALSDKTEQP